MAWTALQVPSYIQWYMSWFQGGMNCGYQNMDTCFRYSAHPPGASEYDRVYAWHKGSAHGHTNTLCMDGCLRVPPAISMLYPCLQEDVDCTYESIHTCHRYSAHPLGVDEYNTAYAASGTMPSTYCMQTSQATDGCRCLRPA